MSSSLVFDYPSTRAVAEHLVELSIEVSSSQLGLYRTPSQTTSKLRPVILCRSVGFFEISDSSPIQRKYGNAEGSLDPRKTSILGRFHCQNAENTANADTKTRKMQAAECFGHPQYQGFCQNSFSVGRCPNRQFWYTPLGLQSLHRTPQPALLLALCAHTIALACSSLSAGKCFLGCVFTKIRVSAQTPHTNLPSAVHVQIDSFTSESTFGPENMLDKTIRLWMEPWLWGGWKR